MENHIKCKCVLYRVSLLHVIFCDLADRILHVISGNGTLKVPGPYVDIPNTNRICKESICITRRERCSGRRTAGAWLLILSANYRDLQHNLSAFQRSDADVQSPHMCLNCTA